MISPISTSSFKRSYIASSSVLAALLVLSAIANLGGKQSSIVYSVVAVVVSAAPFLPFILRQGLSSNLRVAACIACVFALAFGVILAVFAKEFVETGGAEGPRGEGSPLAIVVAMTLFALIFFCPWLLTAIRGLQTWSQMKISEQAVPSDGHKPSSRDSSTDPTSPADAH